MFDSPGLEFRASTFVKTLSLCFRFAIHPELRAALSLSHLTYCCATITVNFHRLDHPPFPCTSDHNPEAERGQVAEVGDRTVLKPIHYNLAFGPQHSRGSGTAGIKRSFLASFSEHHSSDWSSDWPGRWRRLCNGPDSSGSGGASGAPDATHPRSAYARLRDSDGAAGWRCSSGERRWKLHHRSHARTSAGDG
jgi:hypothetical protein